MTKKNKNKPSSCQTPTVDVINYNIVIIITSCIPNDRSLEQYVTSCIGTQTSYYASGVQSCIRVGTILIFYSAVTAQSDIMI